MINPICACCGKFADCGAMNRFDNIIICMECLKYAPKYYGKTTGRELIEYIKKKKNKKWWQFWK